MPKMKTHSGTKKRIKITGTGKLKRKQAFKSHILEKKSPQRKTALNQTMIVKPADEKRVKKLLGL
jgi:large subunit ribosomal protein L35